MRITVLGTGYVGLVTAACLAERGHEVTGYDVVPDKIARLSRGEPTIYEPGLEEILKAELASGRLRFTGDLEAAISAGDVLFVCVGTPQGNDGRADLSQVEGVARTIALHLDAPKVIVEKSTVPVKTAQWIRRTIELYRRGDVPFSVASNPEFLREGSAVADFRNPDRIVLGVEDDRARTALEELYADYACPKVVVDLETAEIIKHASNSFLATKISFINMVAELCDAVGADVDDVARGMGLDPRIGPQFLRAGLGYGGSCFPKDVRAFIRIAEDHGVDFGLLERTDAVNDRRVPYAVARLKDLLWVLRGKSIALWGLAFKPNTDDVREAPSLRLARMLIDEGATLRAWDPEAAETFRAAFGEGPVTYHETPLEAARGAHAVIVATDWPELREVDPAALREALETPVVLDARNHLDAAALAAAGLVHRGIGRPSPSPVGAASARD